MRSRDPGHAPDRDAEASSPDAGSRRGRLPIGRILASALVAGSLVTSLLSAASAADLIGTVRRNKQPAPNATVELEPVDPSAGPKKGARTDAAGRYTISGVVPGAYYLICDGARRQVTIDYAINREDCDL